MALHGCNLHLIYREVADLININVETCSLQWDAFQREQEELQYEAEYVHELRERELLRKVL